MALNKVVLQGNLVRDTELLTTSTGNTYLRNVIASQRNFVKEGEERQSDFVNIIAYGKSAEFIDKFFNKGSQILVEGRIQTGSYEKEDGQKVYTTDVVVDHIYFCGYKTDNAEKKEDINEVVTNFNSASDDELPF